MASEHIQDVTRRLALLDTEINALDDGAAKTAVRASYTELVRLLALCGWDLRRGYNLPAA